MKQIVANEKVKGFLYSVMAVCIAYPFINLLRKQSGLFVGFPIHIREISFMIVALFTLYCLQLFFNDYIARVRWLKNNVRLRIVAGLLSAAWTVPLVCIPIYLLFFPRYMTRGADHRTMIFFCIILLFLLLLFLFNYHFKDYLRRFEEATITQEKLRYEKMLAQYKSLQNQVSPHFLFNCLNDLSALIHQKPAIANDVVLVLSDTLRYIIGSQDKILTDLQSELDFLNNYLFLQLIRVPGSIQLSLNIEPGFEKKSIPPATLQILVENAIKHNHFSSQKKLMVFVRTLSGNRLEVCNSVAPLRLVNNHRSTGTGLKNIFERYSFLTHIPVAVQRNDEYFKVIVPLLEN